MKKALSVLVFSIFVLSSSIFSQSLRTVQNESRSTNSIVVYAGIRAFSDGKGVWLEWQTSSETKNLGFRVYRLTNGQRELASPNFIGGSYLRAGEEQTVGDRYSFFDPQGSGSDVYFIESLDINGQTQFSNEIYPQYVPDIKQLAGRSSTEMTQNAEKAETVIEESRTAFSETSLNKTAKRDFAFNLETHRWVVSQPGVKIGIKKEGFYRVTRAELQAGGFDVNSSPANWRLFLNGIEQAIIVHPSGDYIEFYGFGLDTRETDTQVYFLISGTVAGKRIQTSTLTNNSNAATLNFVQDIKYKYRALYISDILNGEDVDNFFGNQIISSTTGVNVNFEVPDIDCDAINGPEFPCYSKRLTIFVGIQGLTQTSHTIQVELNGVFLGTITGAGHQLMNQNFKISAAVPGRVNQGTNTLRLSTTGNAGDVSLLESISVNYRRKYKAQNNTLKFTTAENKRSFVRGFATDTVRVFDLINRDEPARLNVPVISEGDTFRVDLPANEARAMLAVEDSALSQVSWIEPNSPSTLWAAANNAQLLIVTHKDFTAQANAWAAMRGGQGILSKVVQIEDVFDEFNFGASDSLALRSFFLYAKDNWQTPPQYILLIGDASYDYRNYEGRGYNNYIPTKMVDTIYMETGSDETLADFNNDGLAEISIGRIPARQASMVTQVMNKVISFEQSLPNWSNRGALFAYDQPIGYDFLALSQRISNHLPPSMQKSFIGRTSSTNPIDVQANQIDLLNEMSTGKYIVNYSGHGASGTWAASSFFSVNNVQIAQPTTQPTVPVLRNSNNFSVFTMLTCLNGYFIRNDFDSLSEVLLKGQWYEQTSPGNYQVHEIGASASWTSSGKTTPDVQEVMATRFLQQITAGNMTRFGDLVKDAKTMIVGGRDVRLSWVLLGDPTMRLR